MLSDTANREFVEWLKGQIENALQDALSRVTNGPQQKEYYTPAEVAKLLGKAEWTVREWCRNERVNAEKRPVGRGRSLEWIISHDELTRIRNHGLLPQPTFRFNRTRRGRGAR